MRLLLAVCFAIALGGIAYAQPHGSTGAGNRSCAKYAELKRNFPEEADLAFLGWAQGYMSGINLGGLVQGSHSYRDLSQTPEQITFFLKQYCDANPSANFKDGVIQLLKSLPPVSEDGR
jgi:hypothetical protein